MLQAGFKLTTTTDTQLFVYHYPISLVDGILPCCLPSCFPALSTPPPLSSWSQRKAEVINHRQMVEGNGTRAQYGHNAHNYSSLNRCTENTAGHHYIITLWVRPRWIHVEMTQHFLTSNGTNDEWYPISQSKWVKTICSTWVLRIVNQTALSGQTLLKMLASCIEEWHRGVWLKLAPIFMTGIWLWATAQVHCGAGGTRLAFSAGYCTLDVYFKDKYVPSWYHLRN